MVPNAGCSLGFCSTSHTYGPRPTASDDLGLHCSAHTWKPHMTLHVALAFDLMNSCGEKALAQLCSFYLCLVLYFSPLKYMRTFFVN